MRRHWWRFVLTALFLGAGLPMLTPAPAVAAPASVTFVCPPGTTAEVCAAVNTIEITLKALELISPGLAPAWLLGIMEDLTVTAPLPDYEAKFNEILTEVCGGGSPAPGCVEWEGRDAAIAQRIKEAAKAAVLLGLACATGAFNWSWVCPDPTDGLANSDYLVAGGATTFGGQLLDWDKTPTNPPVSTGDTADNEATAIIIPAALGSSTTITVFQITSGSGSYMAAVEVSYGTILGEPVVRARMCVDHGGSSCSADTPNVPVVVGEPFAIGMHLTACVFASACDARLVVGSTLGTGSVTWMTSELHVSAMMFVGRPGDNYATPLTWACCTSRPMQFYEDLDWTALQEKIGLFNPAHGVPTELEVTPVEAPPRPGTEELPTPTTEALPSTTTIPAPPAELEPSPHPDTGTLDEKRNGLLENLVTGVASGFNWLGNMLGGLLRSVVDMIRWLGDIFGYWIRWLWERLGAVLRSIRDAINSLGDLFEWMLQQVINGISAVTGVLWDVLEAIWRLPALIGEAILSGLYDLFVPASLPSFPPCETTFPCNWVEEVNATIGGIKSGIDGAGSCTAPVIGWSGGFEASFPPPPGCSGGNPGAAGANDATAGDLFGWRTTIRTVFALALWLGFIAKLLQMAPWSKPGDMPLGEGQVTV